MRGELTSPPRLRNPRIPKALSDVVMKAMAPQITARYQRAADLLDDVLALGPRGDRRSGRGAAAQAAADDQQDIQARLRAREAPQPRFCWHCHKPLHARSDRCPFCGEAQ